MHVKKLEHLLDVAWSCPQGEALHLAWWSEP